MQEIDYTSLGFSAFAFNRDLSREHGANINSNSCATGEGGGDTYAPEYQLQYSSENCVQAVLLCSRGMMVTLFLIVFFGKSPYN